MSPRASAASRRVPAAQIWAQAQAVLVGGVNSPVRAYQQVGSDPVLARRAAGAVLTSTEGRAYIDFIMGWGALLWGHQPPAITRALQAALPRLVLAGLTHEGEVTLASLIAQAMPGIEQVRFTVSGTEACMTAVRLARAVTGRTRVLSFTGGYHGHSDVLMAGHTAGIPAALASHRTLVAYNDVAALRRAVDQQGKELACIIVEPVAANTGVLPPAPGFLQALRELATRSGALLIFDEVVTGFRLAPGGAQQHFGVQADLTILGKIIGGGLPIGAVGGPRLLMQRLAPLGDVYHGGTFAGHPLSMVAGATALQWIQRHPPYAQLERRTTQLTHALAQAAQAAGVPIQINRVGSMFTVFFSDQPVRNAAEAQASRRDRFACWANALREQGVLIPPSPFEALFVSPAHTPRQLRRFAAAAAAAFRAVAQV
jgi:glutamate-1-semialdehyde 2,1-aminomutase